ncbi:TRAP-type mannitol/chloroaromatic compound transport system permease small subunit [Stella humosa]|uniref:TRAP transporter small permease protein n=1 Tax=Stella humosa TaxID=94 RepID=A0A3N1MAV8_9PROT|nr:TRAP transporter small permease subunit [Stella humosa]ROQ00399.1 TRAP-type mannitol/chloroaromatic compound transport system permease small subunit [Stella humosa]BBK30358.1 C4-dicarboxylate ABC transporter [Stella humosa]
MNMLLRLARAVDRASDAFGHIASWLVLLACLVSAGNAASRYAFSLSSNAWLEIQWYMFAGTFLLGAATTLRQNGHVRVDLVFSMASPRGRLWIDILGLVFFLLPATAILAWMTWPFFLDSWTRGEGSSNAGGLLRWPVKLLMPVAFVLVTLQGLAELVKRVAALRGLADVQLDEYHKPLQ